MDKDHSGHLSVDELYVGLRNAGIAMKKEDVVDIVNSVDVSNIIRAYPGKTPLWIVNSANFLLLQSFPLSSFL